MLSLELFVTVRFLGVVVVQHTLSPDFEWVGDVPGFFDEEFARIFRQYTFRDSDHDEDLRSLPQFFLSGARPDFPTTFTSSCNKVGFIFDVWDCGGI